jgi:hypothetical protein
VRSRAAENRVENLTVRLIFHPKEVKIRPNQPAMDSFREVTVNFDMSSEDQIIRLREQQREIHDLSTRLDVQIRQLEGGSGFAGSLVGAIPHLIIGSAIAVLVYLLSVNVI